MFHNILVGLDGSVHSTRALAEAVELAQGSDARLTVMTSVPEQSSWMMGAGAYGALVDLSALDKETEREYATMLDAAVDSLPAGIGVTKLLVRGRAAQRILEQVEKGNHDLVVLGSRGRGEVRSLLLGSVSHEVLNSNRAATLVVHAEADQD